MYYLCRRINKTISMKKKIALFLFLLINAVGMSAQGLDGSWKSNFSKKL